MSELKCPFCQQKMNKSENNMFYCGTDNCDLRYIEMPKKAVEDFAESYQNRLNDCKRIGNLNEELIRTRKALARAKDTLHWYDDNYDSVVARNTLDEITALEQKDVK